MVGEMRGSDEKLGGKGEGARERVMVKVEIRSEKVQGKGLAEW